MKRWWMLLVCQGIGILLALPAVADEVPNRDIDALRAEVIELRALVRKLTEQLTACNQRLSRLEQIAAPIGTNQPAEALEDAKPLDEKPLDARLYLRFPIEVERAMMADPAEQRRRLRELLRKRDPMQLLPVLPESKNRPRWFDKAEN